MDYGIWSVIPIIITLAIAFWRKNVFLALLSGITAATVIIGTATGNFLTGPGSIPAVFTDLSTTKTTLFILMTGSVMTVVSRSGGVEGLVRYCTEKRRLVKSPVGAQLISFVLGLLLFVDGTSSIAVTALVGRPFFKKYGVPEEKLALISNSTGSAVAWIIPFGSACAVLTTFFTPVAKELGITQDPFSVVMSSVVFQFYTIALLILVLASILFRFNIGPMKRAFSRGQDGPEEYRYETRTADKGSVLARNMIVPIVFMVACIFAIILITGQGDLAAGDGGTAVFAAGLLTLLLTGAWYIARKVTTVDEYTAWCMDGMKNMFDLVVILVLAYAFGSLLSVLGTAGFLAQYARMMPRTAMLAAGFLIATVIAYATGTSGGTAAVLVPTLTPVLVPLGIPAAFVLGAIISGAVFGDQNSPISDSVILTSSVTGVPIMDHVRTQTPYTVIAWAAALVGYLILGFTY